MDDVAELLLFSAARADLAKRVIEPAKKAGRDVVCDRYVDSTAAYQGVARGIGLGVVEDLMKLVVGSCMPERTVLLRVDPDAAHARGQQRLAAGEADGADRFESKGVGFQRAVAAAYDEIAALHPDRIVSVDGEGEPGEVHRRVLEAVGG
jgi:dTMP kinase